MSATIGPSASISRKPRLRVSVSDSVFMPQAQDLPEVIEVKATTTNTYRAGKFSIEAAIRPADPLGAAFWSQAPDPRIEIFFGLADAGGSVAWQSMMLARADSVVLDPFANMVTIEGRDLTGLLIDSKTAQTFKNQTSSQIATTMAQAAGLNTQITATSTPVGQYYQIDHTLISLDQFHHSMTDWDVLTYLAQHEGFDLFVQRDTLYFQPPTTATTPPFKVLYQIDANGNPVGNVNSLHMHHSKTLAKDVKVTVKSWNSKQNKVITATAMGSNAKSKGGYNPAQQYVFVRPNMTLDAAQKFATQQLAEITRHERVIDFEMPGEMTLTPRALVQLTGTGTDFDQTYYPDEIERTMSFHGGFKQSVRAKNHSPQSQVQPS